MSKEQFDRPMRMYYLIRLEMHYVYLLNVIRSIKAQEGLLKREEK